MDFNYQNIYSNLGKIIQGNEINLSECSFIHPWAIIFICLLLTERCKVSGAKIVLPNNPEVSNYLKRVHFDGILDMLEFKKAAESLREIKIIERENSNVQEIVYCRFKDIFNARLDNFVRLFTNFGLDKNQTGLVVALVGELGNNTFDHNLGNWPTDISGCFITAQNYPRQGRLEFVIGDPGIGFLGSLKNKFPELKDDVSAIKCGLAGNTGWIGVNRGNGLRFVQEWTLGKFSGNVIIHSGAGLVKVGGNGMECKKVPRILGTIVQIMLYYNHRII